MDYSTLNLEALQKRPEYTGKARISDSMGVGCHLDPPGYPSYFLQNLWAANGDYSSRGAYQVIVEPDGTPRTIFTQEDDSYKKEVHEAKLRRLWSPLPIDHPRTDAWMRHIYGYFGRMYVDPSIPNGTNVDKMVQYPVPSYELVKVGLFIPEKLIPSFILAQDWMDAATKATVLAQEGHMQEVLETRLKEAVAAFTAKRKAICTPENSAAVRYIQRFYPEHQPVVEWLNGPIPDAPAGRGNWWETEAQRPTPENCKPRSCGPHPVNKSWCQWCGWKKDEDK